MMLPGLISLAFYKRVPTIPQFALGLAASVGIGALIGYPFSGNPIRGGPFWAGFSAGVLYVAIVAVFYYLYRPRPAVPPESVPPAAAR
ncbi:MAG TPA: hypothetical protein VN864_04505 [Thermoplasmata archaeon]|nr:hypothetical protein [Thermoplasmata archaeon]